MSNVKNDYGSQKTKDVDKDWEGVDDEEYYDSQQEMFKKEQKDWDGSLNEDFGDQSLGNTSLPNPIEKEKRRNIIEIREKEMKLREVQEEIRLKEEESERLKKEIQLLSNELIDDSKNSNQDSYEPPFPDGFWNIPY